MKKRICSNPECRAEIVYGYAASADGKEEEFMCDECLNVLNSGYDPYDGNYEPPAFFPVRQPGRC
jgi:hypothetical protein